MTLNITAVCPCQSASIKEFLILCACAYITFAVFKSDEAANLPAKQLNVIDNGFINHI